MDLQEPLGLPGLLDLRALPAFLEVKEKTETQV